jgi:cell division protein FtsI/penicillin-binding protein 2
MSEFMEHRTPRFRLLLLAIVAVLWMGAVFARLSYLQLFRYTEYLGRAQRQQQRIIEISPQRGALYDRNQRELAMSIAVDSLFAVPSEITDAPMVARLLAGVLNTSAEEIETKLQGSRSFVWLQRKLPQEQAERIEALNLRGIYFQKENRRFYPKRELAAHVLGYVDIDEKGLGGVEYQFDRQVRPRPGKLLILADARRRWYERSEQAADTGASLVLTLDEKIQYIAEKELAAAIAKTHAQAGAIVVQDPNTGELLAVANWPTFNPNQPGETPAEARMDRAIAATYEPGSTFKIVTVAGALEEGITRPDEVVDCQNGAIYIAGHRIRDHKPFGLLTVSQILAKSSDVGAIKLGLRLGAPKLYEYIRAFGFGRPTGIELPGETRGLLKPADKWTPASVGAISMGQEVGVTSVQLISAFSTIANGGVLHPARIVRETRRGGQAIPARAEPGTRVISPTTAATLRRMFEGVVLEGTGSLARLDGYSAAGKTGTAQKIDPKTGTYSHSQFIASFVGFAPVNTPAMTVLVMLDSPVGGYHGGDVAAPVFKRVAEQVLAYMDVPHDVAVSPQQLAALKGKPQPRPDVSDFDPVQVETAGASSALPVFPAEMPATAASSAAQTVALAEGEGVVVPQLAGLTVRSVTEQCLKLGLNPVLIGTGVAVEQNPANGATVRVGSRITVRFTRSALGQN